MVQGQPIRGVLIDQNKPRPSVETIKDCLADYYRILDCSTIECTHRVIGGIEYDLVCDEEGTFKTDISVTAIDGNHEPQLVRNIFIIRGNYEAGEWESLTDEDVKNILGHTANYIDGDNRIRPVLVMDGPYGMGEPAEEDD